MIFWLCVKIVYGEIWVVSELLSLIVIVIFRLYVNVCYS